MSPSSARAGRPPADERPCVVIVGGGFGGLSAARGLAGAPVDLVLIDRMNHHLFQPLLYQVASAALSPGDIAHPIREILARQRNARVVMGEVDRIEPAERRVILGNGESVTYDHLILAVGARHTYFSHPEWEARAPGLKTLRDALDIRERILLSFERAERRAAIEEVTDELNFVVVGAGPTGVEMAGAIAEIARRTMLRNFRRIDPATARVYLVEAGPDVLPSYPDTLRCKARRQLEELGVSVWTESPVVAVDDEGVEVEGGRRIRSTNVVWAAGNQASPLLESLGVKLDRQGRVPVGPDLTVPGHPEICVIGDAACCPDVDGQPLPGIAPVAIQQGKYLARQIRRAVEPADRPPFRYVDRGTMATIGKAKAVGVVGPLRLSGLLAWLAWSLIHIFFLIGFRNRLQVMIEWIFWYVTGQRSTRLIQRPLEAEPDRAPLDRGSSHG